MNQKEKLLVGLMTMIKFMLPFFLQHEVYELHRDEYLYYAQGRHLAAGYLENPPLIGVLGSISSLLGGSPFWIKFWPALFGALTIWVTASHVKLFGGNLFALFLASAGMMITAYLRIHFLFQPNFLEIFFWTLSLYFLARYLNEGNKKYLYLLSAALVFGWHSKYSVLFLIAAIGLSVLLTRHRVLFLRKETWLAAGVFLLLIIPNILWQYSHNWPLVHHMQELRDTQLQYINRGDFIKEQLLFLLPVLMVWTSGLIWLFRQKSFRPLAFVYLFVILLLLFGSGKGYYALGLYPMLIAAGSAWLEHVTRSGKAWRYALVAIIFLLALPFIPLLMPMQTPEAMAESNRKYSVGELGLLRWEDQKNHALQQDFADMIGWKELTRKAEKFYSSLDGVTKWNTMVYCRSYGQAGSLQYYASDSTFRKRVFSDNGTFLLWIPKRLYFEHLLFIGRQMPDKDDVVWQNFEQTILVDSVTNPLSRQYGDRIIFFYNVTDSALILANQGLKEKKARFGE